MLVSRGAGMIAGLEIWNKKGKFILVDSSTDGRFANDVAQWNGAAGLNTPSPKKRKDAKKQDPASPRTPNSNP